METNQALDALGALAQETRLAVFRLLVRAGPDGMAAGEIATALDVLQNTLSANLAVLSRSGLIRSRREGRSIRYFAEFDRMSNLLAYLIEDCCGGSPDTCQPLIAQIRCNPT